MLTLRRIALGGLAFLAGCGDDDAPCPRCDTIVVAAVREPPQVLPPLVVETVGRDVADRVWEPLARLAPGGASIDAAAYRPALAERWERTPEGAWRFRLRPGARWHDGTPVTAADVVFSLAAYRDTALGAPAGAALDGVEVVAEDSATVLVRVPAASPEPLYDLTWSVRILPRHVWDTIPRARWGADTSVARLVGSGPWRAVAWRRGESLTLERADTAALAPDAARRLVWRFAADPEAALNLVLAGEADLLETTVGPAQLTRAQEDSGVRIVRYPSAVYGFLAFRAADARGAAHPVLGETAVRRALAQGIDRATIATAVFGPGTEVPPGPVSRLSWIVGARAPGARDSAGAAAALDAAGWRTEGDGVRARRGMRLAFEILVPSSSPARRQLAEALQAAWRGLGADVGVTGVEFAAFQERLAAGRFDAYIGAYLDEPSPRGLAEQWTRQGWGALNYGRWASAAFDSLFAAARAVPEPARARAAWAEALDTLAAEAPAIFLYTPSQAAVVSRRLDGVRIDPYSWLNGVESWRVDRRATRNAGAS